MKKLWLFILLGLASLLTVRGQDYHFSQFYANPLYLSPSLAGATDGGRVAMNYRNQWPGITEAFSTYSISFDNFFSKYNSGIGFYLMQDNAGSAGLKSTNAAFQYSYNLVLSDEWQVVPAFQMSYGNRRVDLSKVIFPDQSPDGSSGTGAWERLENDEVHYVDFAASVFVYSSKYWMGLTVDHLSKPNYSFMNEQAQFERKYVLFGGMNIWTERTRGKSLNRSFATSFRYQHQGGFNQADIGVYWYNGPLELGCWYRGLPFFNEAESSALNQDAIVVLLGYDFGMFRMGYSYDINISNLGWSTAGAHELSVIIEFNQKGNLRLGGRRPAVPCSEAANQYLNNSRSKSKRRRMY